VSGEIDVRALGLKQRTLFVALVLPASDTVSVDELLDALWGNAQPAGAVQRGPAAQASLR
jgi:DNA-binding SARP family transcriptional activator